MKENYERDLKNLKKEIQNLVKVNGNLVGDLSATKAQLETNQLHLGEVQAQVECRPLQAREPRAKTLRTQKQNQYFLNLEDSILKIEKNTKSRENEELLEGLNLKHCLNLFNYKDPQLFLTMMDSKLEYSNFYKEINFKILKRTFSILEHFIAYI